jgi:hypothetical protein
VFGTASANSTTGALDVLQRVDLASNQDSSWAAIFITFNADRAASISVTPEVDWSYSDYRHVDQLWADRTAHLDGSITFTANVLIIPFELTHRPGDLPGAETSLKQLPGQMSFQVWQISDYVTAQSQYAMSGSLQNGSTKSLVFSTSPGPTFVVGVFVQLVESNNVHNVQGDTIPPIPDGAFNVYALLKADVPSIWVSAI